MSVVKSLCSCVKGYLVEVNERLQDHPYLLKTKVIILMCVWGVGVRVWGEGG